jgi:hypothetical protein
MSRRRVHIGKASVLAVGLLVTSPLYHRDGVAAPKFGGWSAPVNLGSLVNSEFAEFAGHTSKDGLSLYFASTRPPSYGSFGGEDLWVSQRVSTDAPWGIPMNLGQVINTASNDRSPALSRDGHYLFFASDRPGGLGALDLWVSWRSHTHDDFGWEEPVNLGAVINSGATDAGPSFLANGDGGLPQLYLASNRAGGPGGLDIYVSALLDGLFQPPALVQALSTAQTDLTPSVRHDGLEIVIASNRPGGAGGQDLWAATRSTVNDSWSTPASLGMTVNSAANENFPSLSADRNNLYFNSDRPGGFGATDLYISTRDK